MQPTTFSVTPRTTMLKQTTQADSTNGCGVFKKVSHALGITSHKVSNQKQQYLTQLNECLAVFLTTATDNEPTSNEPTSDLRTEEEASVTPSGVGRINGNDDVTDMKSQFANATSKLSSIKDKESFLVNLKNIITDIQFTINKGGGELELDLLDDTPPNVGAALSNLFESYANNHFLNALNYICAHQYSGSTLFCRPENKQNSIIPCREPSTPSFTQTAEDFLKNIDDSINEMYPLQKLGMESILKHLKKPTSDDTLPPWDSVKMQIWPSLKSTTAAAAKPVDERSPLLRRSINYRREESGMPMLEVKDRRSLLPISGLEVKDRPSLLPIRGLEQFKNINEMKQAVWEILNKARSEESPNLFLVHACCDFLFIAEHYLLQDTPKGTDKQNDVGTIATSNWTYIESLLSYNKTPQDLVSLRHQCRHYNNWLIKLEETFGHF